MFNQVGTTPASIEDIPEQFLMSREQMEDEALEELNNGDMDFDEFTLEMQAIEDYYRGKQ